MSCFEILQKRDELRKFREVFISLFIISETFTEQGECLP